jgi:cell division protein FtsB
MVSRRGDRRRGETTVPVTLPVMESAPERWLRNIRVSGFAFIVLSLVIASVVVLAPGLRIFVEQQTQIAALTASVEDQKNSVEQLEADVARWDDPAYVEALARDKLYYAYPGDLTYLVIDDGATPTGGDGVPVSDEIQSLQVDWVRALVSSIYTAGLTDATAAELVSPQLVSPTLGVAP